MNELSLVRTSVIVEILYDGLNSTGNIRCLADSKCWSSTWDSSQSINSKQIYIIQHFIAYYRHRQDWVNYISTDGIEVLIYMDSILFKNDRHAVNKYWFLSQLVGIVTTSAGVEVNCILNEYILWYHRINTQIARYFYTNKAACICWEILLNLIEELLHFLKWNISFEVLDGFLQVLIGNILLAFLNHWQYINAQSWDIIAILLEQLLCFCRWDIFAISINCVNQILIRNMFFMWSKESFQFLYRKVGLIVSQ